MVPVYFLLTSIPALPLQNPNGNECESDFVRPTLAYLEFCRGCKGKVAFRHISSNLNFLTFAEAPKRALEWSEIVDLGHLFGGPRGGVANGQNQGGGVALKPLVLSIQRFQKYVFRRADDSKSTVIVEPAIVKSRLARNLFRQCGPRSGTGHIEIENFQQSNGKVPFLRV